MILTALVTNPLHPEQNPLGLANLGRDHRLADLAPLIDKLVNRLAS